MKKMYILFTILLASLFCGCSVHSDGSGDNSVLKSDEMPILPIGPTTEPTLENVLYGTNNLLVSARDSFNIMTELASKDSASKKGIKAAQKVTKKYGERLAELENTDLTSFTADELMEISSELSDMISAIRSARDLLN